MLQLRLGINQYNNLSGYFLSPTLDKFWLKYSTQNFNYNDI